MDPCRSLDQKAKRKMYLCSLIRTRALLCFSSHLLRRANEIKLGKTKGEDDIPVFLSFGRVRNVEWVPFLDHGLLHHWLSP